MEPESRYVTSQRVQLHYVVWGEADKPPLILLHGGRDHARSWDRTALALIDRYQVFAVDLRGHGDSDWALGGNYSIIDYALDLHAVVVPDHARASPAQSRPPTDQLRTKSSKLEQHRPGSPTIPRETRQIPPKRPKTAAIRSPVHHSRAPAQAQ